MDLATGEGLVEGAVETSAAAVTPGGGGQRSGVFDHAAGAAHSRWPTATHWPLLESAGSPHQAHPPREAHWPQ
jgi:hypothetical protein